MMSSIDDGRSLSISERNLRPRDACGVARLPAAAVTARHRAWSGAPSLQERLVNNRRLQARKTSPGARPFRHATPLLQSLTRDM